MQLPFIEVSISARVHRASVLAELEGICLQMSKTDCELINQIRRPWPTYVAQVVQHIERGLNGGERLGHISARLGNVIRRPSLLSHVISCRATTRKHHQSANKTSVPMNQSHKAR